MPRRAVPCHAMAVAVAVACCCGACACTCACVCTCACARSRMCASLATGGVWPPVGPDDEIELRSDLGSRWPVVHGGKERESIVETRPCHQRIGAARRPHRHEAADLLRYEAAECRAKGLAVFGLGVCVCGCGWVCVCAVGGWVDGPVDILVKRIHSCLAVMAASFQVSLLRRRASTKR